MKQSQTASADTLITNRLFGFVHLLRSNGYNLNSADIKAAHLIVTQGALTSEVLLRDALRCIFCQSHSQWCEFPILFKIYWWAPGAGKEQSDTTASNNQTRSSETTGLSYFSESLAQEKTLAGHTDTIDVHSGGASDARTLSQRDFRFVFNPHDMRRIERIVDDLSRRVQKRLRRRAKQDRIRGQLDLRRTARNSLRHSGWPFELHFRRKQKSPARFLLLLDVSQSMEIYSYLFLRFARGLLQVFKDTDAYAFHTDLIHIGAELKDKSTQRLESKLKNLSSGWLGGTRIAESLKNFNQNHASQVLHNNTIVIVFSDGYDSGEPDDLVDEILQIKSKCRKVVWVNPLLGRGTNPEPLPVEKSLFAVLPHLDLYTSAHNLTSLKNLEAAFRLR